MEKINNVEKILNKNEIILIKDKNVMIWFLGNFFKKPKLFFEKNPFFLKG